MARPAYAERVHGELAALKNMGFSAQQQEAELDAPIPQLDTLWHYDCVVSPRSPAAKLHSNLSSPRSPAAKLHSNLSSPRSPAAKLQSNPPSPPSPAAIDYPHVPTTAAMFSAFPPSHAVADSQSGALDRSSPSPPPISRPLSLSSLRSPPLSPRSHASSSTATPSPLSRFAPPPEQQVLQRVFSTFDENGDGSVSTLEISRIFQKLGITKSEDSIQALLGNSSGLVTKSQGHVDEEEFLRLFESACCFVDANASSSCLNADVDQDLLAAFHVFDKDGNGFISPAELQSVLCSLGFPQGHHLEACADMIARVDENGDGQVDFFEFKKLFHMDNPFLTSIQSF